MLSECDYNAAAELFPARRRVPKMQPLSYKLFARASQAIRFAVGDIAREPLLRACLEVDERRYGCDEIRRFIRGRRLSALRPLQAAMIDEAIDLDWRCRNVCPMSGATFAETGGAAARG